MPNAAVGQRVQVDIAGLDAPGVQIGQGVTATGVITAIDVATRLITVALDVSFSGDNIVRVSPEKVKAIQ
jgi:hypothetical protein